MLKGLDDPLGGSGKHMGTDSSRLFASAGLAEDAHVKRPSLAAAKAGGINSPIHSGGLNSPIPHSHSPSPIHSGINSPIPHSHSPSPIDDGHFGVQGSSSHDHHHARSK